MQQVTVSELIEVLKKQDPSAYVLVGGQPLDWTHVGPVPTNHVELAPELAPVEGEKDYE